MKKAFTLVELIVVITILAILWTIAFISLQWYSREARDSKRIQDIRSLLTKLNVENVKGTPYRDMLSWWQIHYIDINWNAEEVYQWNIDYEYLRESRENFLDPKTNKDYDFATSEWTTKYKAEDQRFNFIEWRYESEKTNEEVILWNYYKYLSSDAENLFTWAINPYEWPAWITEVPNWLCWDCKNIIIKDWNWKGYTIMDRNLGATSNDISKCNSFTLWACSKDVAWNYFQWWNNTPISWDATISTFDVQIDASMYWPDNINWYYWDETKNFILWTSWNRYDWSIIQNDKLWWLWVSQNDIKNKNNILVPNQWPCQKWYHVPKQEEWQDLLKIYLTYKSISYSSWTYDWSSNTLIRESFVTDLKLPLAGSRNWSTGAFDAHWTHWWYWSSSINGANAYRIRMYSDQIDTKFEHWRAYGFSIRCFKN